MSTYMYIKPHQIMTKHIISSEILMGFDVNVYRQQNVVLVSHSNQSNYRGIVLHIFAEKQELENCRLTIMIWCLLLIKHHVRY